MKALLGFAGFGGSVAACAWWLHHHTLRDADRWLADRRTQVRRKKEEADLRNIERRAKLERRHGEA